MAGLDPAISEIRGSSPRMTRRGRRCNSIGMRIRDSYEAGPSLARLAADAYDSGRSYPGRARCDHSVQCVRLDCCPARRALRLAFRARSLVARAASPVAGDRGAPGAYWPRLYPDALAGCHRRSGQPDADDHDLGQPDDLLAAADLGFR